MILRNKKILIIGGEGFIGRNLVNNLSKNLDCYSVNRSKSVFIGANRVFIKKDPYKDKVENNYDVVIHLIDNKVNDEVLEDKELKLIKNLNISNKNHLILFSSAVVYANPNSEYGKRKLKLEKIYNKYCKENNIKLTIFRLFNAYGYYQLPDRQGSLVANILLNYLNGKETEINDMNACRDFIYAKDIGKFVEYAIKKFQYGTLDLATDNSISINSLLLKIEKAIGKKLLIKDKKNREDIVCPQSKNKLIGQVEITPLEKGLKETFNFYKRNLSIVNKHS